MRILFLALIFLVGCGNLDRLKSSQPNNLQKYVGKIATYKVLTVSDGDTISVQMDGKRVNVRSACIDAPETGHGAKRPGQPLGEAAKQKYQELVKNNGGSVGLNITDTDRYGRKVAEIILNGGMTAQERLAIAGLAWPYERYKANCPSWVAIEAAGKSARDGKLGVYSSSTNLPPWEWRKTRWQ